jgi:ribosomal protein S18 acetylase RimI-like enzyme
MSEIRPTRPDDATAVANCIDTIAKERLYLSSLSGCSREETLTYIEYLERVDGVHLVVAVDDLVIGWCDITPGIFDGLGHVGHLTMGLLKDHRGQGWGKKLLAAALRIAFSKFYERVELYVFASNMRAVEFYRRIGFQQEGVKRKARKLFGKYDDILVLCMLKNEWEINAIASYATNEGGWPLVSNSDDFNQHIPGSELF